MSYAPAKNKPLTAEEWGQAIGFVFFCVAGICTPFFLILGTPSWVTKAADLFVMMSVLTVLATLFLSIFMLIWGWLRES